MGEAQSRNPIFIYSLAHRLEGGAFENTNLRTRTNGAMLICLLVSLTACDTQSRTARQAGDFRPMRIVSLDYCADQYLLQLVEPERILALSRDAGREFSYLREAAAGLPTVRPAAEDVLVLGPDLVIRTYGGGPNAAAFYARAGVAVLDIGNPNTLDEVSAGNGGSRRRSWRIRTRRGAGRGDAAAARGLVRNDDGSTDLVHDARGCDRRARVPGA